MTVPFENLSVRRGEAIVLEESRLFEKIVLRRRGGFCYELNGLFAALLRTLGFRVARLAGRVGVDGIPFDSDASGQPRHAESQRSEQGSEEAVELVAEAAPPAENDLFEEPGLLEDDGFAAAHGQ